MPLYANARAFLNAVYERYRTLDAYSDTGLSRSLGTRHPRLCKFATSHARPSLFRFEFESPHPSPRRRHLFSRCVVGHDGRAPFLYFKHYTGDAGVELPESLDLAVASATGISSGTAHTIGTLLFPEVSGFTLLDLQRLRFRPNRLISGVPGVCVSGLHPRGGRYTAWFGAEDLLLRRLYRSKFKSEELRFNPSTAEPHPIESFAAPRVEA
jgi:hypothetical protein